MKNGGAPMLQRPGLRLLRTPLMHLFRGPYARRGLSKLCDDNTTGFLGRQEVNALRFIGSSLSITAAHLIVHNRPRFTRVGSRTL
jgi:hypothetical protein